MSTRQYCQFCGYPQSVCLCAAIHPVSNTIPVLVLQHPSEVKASKNTVRLLSLALKNIEIHVGETEVDFAHLKPRIQATGTSSILLYPSRESLPLSVNPSIGNDISQLIFLIYGTWRKAYKIWCLNPWLHALPCRHLATAPDSQYQRKTSIP